VLYVSIGKANASIVWKPLLVGAEDKIDTIDIPEEQNLIQIIPIGRLTFSENKGKAGKFIHFVISDEGKTVFEKFGYTPYPDEKYAS
jgi:molybdate transport system substrate-binding protein